MYIYLRYTKKQNEVVYIVSSSCILQIKNIFKLIFRITKIFKRGFEAALLLGIR